MGAPGAPTFRGVSRRDRRQQPAGQEAGRRKGWRDADLCIHLPGAQGVRPDAESGLAWREWFDGMADQVVDLGQPAISPTGVGNRNSESTELAGLFVDLGRRPVGALATAQGCPFLGLDGGVEVAELIPDPGDAGERQPACDMTTLEAPVRLSAAPAGGGRRTPLTIAVTAVAYFMVTLDTLVVVTALPTIHRDLGGSVETLQWTINAYNMAFAAGIITAAALGDPWGRRRVTRAGLGIFTLASAACALAPTTATLIAFRAVQGVGAAIIVPLGLTLLTSAFPAERRGAIVGIWGGIAGLGVAAGPLVGGAVTQGVELALDFLGQRPDRTRGSWWRRGWFCRKRGVYDPGSTCPRCCWSRLAWAAWCGGLVQGPTAGWSSPRVLTALIGGAALLVRLRLVGGLDRRTDDSVATVPAGGLFRCGDDAIPHVGVDLRGGLHDE